jgi:hypothetical protein
VAGRCVAVGLIERIAALAVSGSRVLLVGVPGGDLLRVRAEAVLAARGWGLASAPADADVLMVCGRPGVELRAAIDRVWAQMPAPRVQIAVESDRGLERALDRARSDLLDVAARRRDAAARPGVLEAMAEGAGEEPDRTHGMHDRSAASKDHQRADDGAPAMDMDMDMDMDMAGPAGIPLAGGAEGDRDGLEMDVLHLRLGPVLPDWPAGLVVDCTISGDVIVQADARLLPSEEVRSATAAAGDGMEAAVLRLDRAARLLRIAGWSTQAGRLDRVRNEVLTGAVAGHMARVAAVRRRVGRSLVLRWSLAGVAGAGGVDVRVRVLTMLDEVGDVLRGDVLPPLEPVSPSGIAAQLPGRSLVAARLVVAAGSVAQGAPQVQRA